MVRTFTSSVRIELPAAVYWALRLDPNFDAFCASRDGSVYELVSLSRWRDSATGDEHARAVSSLTSEESAAALPASVLNALNASRLVLDCTATWNTARYDRAHPAIFETRPRVKSARIEFAGENWLTGLDNGRACECAYAVRIDARVPILGRLIETLVERRIRESHGHLNSLALEYVAQRDTWRSSVGAFVEAATTGISADLGISAEPASRAERQQNATRLSASGGLLEGPSTTAESTPTAEPGLLVSSAAEGPGQKDVELAATGALPSPGRLQAHACGPSSPGEMAGRAAALAMEGGTRRAEPPLHGPVARPGDSARLPSAARTPERRARGVTRGGQAGSASACDARPPRGESADPQRGEKSDAATWRARPPPRGESVARVERRAAQLSPGAVQAKRGAEGGAEGSARGIAGNIAGSSAEGGGGRCCTAAQLSSEAALALCAAHALSQPVSRAYHRHHGYPHGHASHGAHCAGGLAEEAGSARALVAAGGEATARHVDRSATARHVDRSATARHVDRSATARHVEGLVRDDGTLQQVWRDELEAASVRAQLARTMRGGRHERHAKLSAERRCASRLGEIGSRPGEIGADAERRAELSPVRADGPRPDGRRDTTGRAPAQRAHAHAHPPYGAEQPSELALSASLALARTASGQVVRRVLV